MAIGIVSLIGAGLDMRNVASVTNQTNSFLIILRNSLGFFFERDDRNLALVSLTLHMTTTFSHSVKLRQKFFDSYEKELSASNRDFTQK